MNDCASQKVSTLQIITPKLESVHRYEAYNASRKDYYDVLAPTRLCRRVTLNDCTNGRRARLHPDKGGNEEG